MDRDTESIGGIKNPKQPTKQLLHVTIVLDLLGILLSFFISNYFAVGIILYILASKAYSYRGIRLKKYPFIGYLTVVIFQGSFTYFLVVHSCSINQTMQVPAIAIISAGLLIGGFYPLTQIYQHKQDKADGVNTISSVLGYRGTFIFTTIIYFLAMSCIGFYLISTLQHRSFYIMQIFFLPTLVYFMWWFYKVYHNTDQANFTNTMRMNILASVCSNASFITLFILEKF